MELLRVEALARSGSVHDARVAVRRLSGSLKSLGVVDPDLLTAFEAVVQGDLPDLDLLRVLRGRAEEQIVERLRRAV